MRSLLAAVRVAAACMLLLTAASPVQAQEPVPAPVPAAVPAPSPTPVPDEQPQSLPDFILPVTDEMRQAAFPDVDTHRVHDQSINWFVLADQMEWESGGGDVNLGWDVKGWVGRDRTRIWFRTEGQRDDGRLADAQSHVFYGRQIARWWDVLVGVRQDFRPGPAQTWAAIGIQGLAPYWFDVEATAYVGASGRTHFRVETAYELLLTNRLILQPQAEMEIYGKDDPDHFRAAGLATLDTGIRLRYLIRRELAPYLGVVWHQKYFGTADLARRNGEAVGGARLVAGVRVWM